ncbi:Ribosomal RNA methyltransferase RrmJ/FtsJ [Metarhizium rileyi]|uniref:Ribosomal RNA methyltransferase RrmJ/FtsJ n=1 Tax=Metarhizium rileyi (strain RCEF 4871) TaxID=1649241 RepID=A0A167GPR4_METRR|nr:Ribosomal RNA methyltransferase RrmJ/FtsJ [Metarhizium rileyi RCEF 4871]
MSHDTGETSQQLRVFSRYGRYYGSWQSRKYLCPIDQEETNRLDLFHKLFLVARHDALCVPNLPETRPIRALDLGTGTGIWAFHVAEKTTRQPVIMAVDLHKIQPALIPPGVIIAQFDIEDPCWDRLITDCDIVHMRMLFGSIHHAMWPRIYRNVFDHLLPGSGYVEHVEIDWVPGWEGDYIPNPSALKEWSDLYLRASETFGRNGRLDSATVRRTMESAGFIDFREEIIRCYVNPWMPDRHERELASWFNLGLSRGVEAMSLMPMIEGLGLKQEEVHNLCQRVIKEICVLSHHAFFHV